MPITDKVAAAKQIGEFLQAVISNGGFKLKYRVTVDPPMAQNREWEHPEILVEFAGPDSALLQVRRTSEPYRFGPMSSRERRIVHLALREEKDLRTESDGEGGRRSVVVYPGSYKTAAPARRERQTN